MADDGARAGRGRSRDQPPSRLVRRDENPRSRASRRDCSDGLGVGGSFHDRRAGRARIPQPGRATGHLSSPVRMSIIESSFPEATRSNRMNSEESMKGTSKSGGVPASLTPATATLNRKLGIEPVLRMLTRSEINLLRQSVREIAQVTREAFRSEAISPLDWRAPVTLRNSDVRVLRRWRRLCFMRSDATRH